MDSNTRLPLDEGLCRAARKNDIDYFISEVVWELRTVNEARTRMGRALISVRWVEVNKGDDQTPNIVKATARVIPDPVQTGSGSHRFGANRFIAAVGSVRVGSVVFRFIPVRFMPVRFMPVRL